MQRGAFPDFSDEQWPSNICPSYGDDDASDIDSFDRDSQNTGDGPVDLVPHESPHIRSRLHDSQQHYPQPEPEPEPEPELILMPTEEPEPEPRTEPPPPRTPERTRSVDAPKTPPIAFTPSPQRRGLRSGLEMHKRQQKQLSPRLLAHAYG